jgi:hypothetical protein
MRGTRSWKSALCSLVLALLTAAVWAKGPESNVTGTWLLSIQMEQGNGGEATFELTEKKGVIKGTYSGAVGVLEVSGTVDGNTVEFGFIGAGGGVAKYRGTIREDGSMAGTCDYGERFGKGTFKGKKEES